MPETKRSVVTGPATFTVSLPSTPKPADSPLVTFTCSVCGNETTAVSHAVNGKGEPVCNPCAAESLRKVAGTDLPKHTSHGIR